MQTHMRCIDGQQHCPSDVHFIVLPNSKDARVICDRDN